MKDADRRATSATALRHRGRPPQASRQAVNCGVERVSTVLFDSLEELDTASAQPLQGLYYGRFGTPTHAALADALKALSGAQECVMYPSGLAAIAGVLLSFLQPGDELLLVDCAYGPTRQFAAGTLQRLGISTRYFPADAGANIENWIGPQTALIFCESPGSLTLELQDLPGIVSRARPRNIPVVVDNTWATPLQCPALALGASVDIQAATKYLAGHADVMLGAALCDPASGERVRKTALAHGYYVSPDDAWLTLRGLRSLDIRLTQHAHSAARIGDWLADQPQVKSVVAPARSDHPQHDLWRRDFTGCNGLISVELAAMPRAQLARFTDGLQYFGLGYSWGGFESLCLPFDPAPQRQFGQWGGRGQLLRLHIGLEDPDDLIADLAAGFKRLGD